jgi:hypothetical protein
MKLSGKVSPDLCLLVLALTEEAQSLDTGLPVLLTGALRPGLNGIHRVNTVIQHDLDTDVLRTSALLDLDDGRLTAMDGAGIDTAVLSLTTPGLQNLAGTEAVALQGPTNDAIATAVRRHLKRFQGFGFPGTERYRLGLCAGRSGDCDRGRPGSMGHDRGDR